jgi:carboxypeptidase Taq
MSKYDELVAHLGEIQNLKASAAVLAWDQQVQMPAGGAEARSNQLSTLARLSHEMLTGEETARLLEEAESEINGADPASDQASMLRVAREDYDDATKLPGDFVAKRAREVTLAHNTWEKAREASDFSLFEEALTRLIDIALQEADYRGYDDHPYDALLDKYERGMTTARVTDIFDNHRPALVDLIARIADADQVDDSMLHQEFDVEKQKDFALRVIKAYGFDFERGVQDTAVHPFCTSFATDDVRITTRFYPNWLNPALFGMMHEAGHGMYEQGVARKFSGTTLQGGATLGVHESQSRMWENLVGRSRGFWEWALPQLKETFPQQLGDVTLDAFYKAINKVERSFIRVEADEATYNLHIMLRFELEKDIITRQIPVSELPDAWNDRFKEFFSLVPPNDAQGVLQDVHWSSGLFGYFPTYALGNLLSVQYYNQALEDRPGIPDDIRQGKFDTLLTWLNENIHQHGRKFTAPQLTRRVTGEDIQSEDYIQYLETKFADIYGF